MSLVDTWKFWNLNPIHLWCWCNTLPTELWSYTVGRFVRVKIYRERTWRVKWMYILILMCGLICRMEKWTSIYLSYKHQIIIESRIPLWISRDSLSFPRIGTMWEFLSTYSKNIRSCKIFIICIPIAAYFWERNPHQVITSKGWHFYYNNYDRIVSYHVTSSARYKCVQCNLLCWWMRDHLQCNNYNPN